VHYRGRKFLKDKTGYKWNHIDVENGDHFWISGPHRDGNDRLYGGSTAPVSIDDDVREEYWLKIRGLPNKKALANAN
jgi:hypothetical protein